MRDIALSLVIFGLIPFVFKRPWIGVLLFIWISVMTPHRMAYGFAFDFPWAAMLAGVTLLSMAMNAKQVKFPKDTITVLLIVLPLWLTVTYLFALVPEAAHNRWVEVMKIFFFILVTASLVQTRQHIEWLLWVIVVSVGFFGLKGGLFTILTGGGARVYGPPGSSFISDNNAIAVALVMTIPLMYYLRQVVTSVWVKRGMLVAMGLCGMAILGTHSRGAFLAVLAMCFFLWLKSHAKVMSGLLLLLLVPVAIGFMPDQWTERMNSIQNYEQDASAMGRINVWHMAVNIANARPLVGGGFELYRPQVFATYAPNPDDIHTAHSIYFQMLGEHGYVGLLIFLSLGILSWIKARRIIAASKQNPEFAWAGQLARAIQISLIGFAVGGAFVNIAYWELQYYEMIVLVAVHRLVTGKGAAPVPSAGLKGAAGAT